LAVVDHSCGPARNRLIDIYEIDADVVAVKRDGLGRPAESVR